MPIERPENWWVNFGKDEKIWISLAVAWGIFMFMMMPLGHFGKQNVSSETYRTSPEEFKNVAETFISHYQVTDESGNPLKEQGISVVNAPSVEEGDAFLIAEAWKFRPILKLKKGKTYRIHMSSLDFQHGFSLQPQNLNFQILPDYDYVITLTPGETGTFHIVCNEFCSYVDSQFGHDTMIGKIIVE